MPEEADRARQRRLEELVARPRETLEIELKGWIDLTLREHQAGLAKALIALANLGGGFVVIGFDEHAGDVRPADGRPTSPASSSRTRSSSTSRSSTTVADATPASAC